ncbi:MAG: hypothetical protein Q9183_001567 [Haloplaca sp. 2 TL-2023]
MKHFEPAVDIPSSINVFTYNCWGLKYIAKYRRERLGEIGRAIATTVPTPEIVGLQECWTQEDYHAIRKQTRHVLPHGKFYFSGSFGGGLAILSKWPIVESNMVRYPLNGRPSAFFRGDWYVGKGVACASIRLSKKPGDIVDVFCTHLHAPYQSEPKDSYLCHRTAQAWEIARLMRQAVERGHAVIGLGDFNMVPSSLAHRLITTHAPVQDVWKVLHPDSSLGSANHPLEKERRRDIPSARYSLQENGATCDGVYNTWRWTKHDQKLLFKGEDLAVDPATPDPRAKRLDYIFFGNTLSHFPDAAQWRIQSARVGMTGRHPRLNCSYSDHFSVEATLVRAASSQSDDPSKPSLDTRQTSDAALRTLTNTSLQPTLYTSFNASPTSSFLPVSVSRTPSPPKPNPIGRPMMPLPRSLSTAAYDEILDLISSDMTHGSSQRRLRFAHFGISIVVSVGCFIAVWWPQRAWVAFVLLLVSTLNFGAGIVDGLIALLFAASEKRALQEFRWEIQQAKDMAEELDDGKGKDIGETQEGLITNDSSDPDKMSQKGRQDFKPEKELWEKVRSSKEYGGKENVRSGRFPMV